MPLVKVEIYQGKSQEYKKAILDGIHEALLTALKIPDDDRTQRLYELPEAHYDTSKICSNDYTLIEITLFKGRTPEAKKQLYAEIVRNLSENPGIDGKDITIVLNEPPLENWGIFGGKPASEVDLGYKLDV